jgi:PAS domain S-box-containing protein
MAATDDLARLLADRAAVAGPAIDTPSRAEAVAELLEAVRAVSTTDAAGNATDEPTLDWSTPEMDAAPLSMVISGPAYEDNPIQYVNAAFERLTGYAASDVRGRNLRLLQGPDTAREPVETLRAAIDIWEPTVVELRNYRADGTPFRNRVAVAPIADETGTIANWVGVQEAVHADDTGPRDAEDR